MYPLRLQFLLWCCLWLSTLPAAAADDAKPGGEVFAVALGEETEITGRHYAANGPTVLWIASGYGLQPRHDRLARALAGHDVDVWLADLLESLFLPRGTAAIRALDGRRVATLAIHLCRQRGRPVTLVTGSYGAIPVLRGARRVQGEAPDCLAGAMLFSPSFLARVPGLGEDPEFVPIIDHTNIPLVIFAAEKNSNRGQMDEVRRRLERAGARVWLRPMPGVTALFYEGDNAPATRRMLEAAPLAMARLLPLLNRMPTPPPLPMAGDAAPPGPQQGTGIDDRLRPFRGNPQPPPLDLPTADGRRVRIDDYRGQVTLVNFWASWCAPCVKEIPSLNRLKTRMAGRPFRLISVNYGESAQQVHAFLRRVEVRFPVLLDIDGAVARQWKVFAFPSTFVIDSEGRIRYGVNAAIHWDDAAVIEMLEGLIPGD